MIRYLEIKKDTSSFQTFAAHMWPQPSQPLILGSVKVEMSNSLEFIKKYSEHHNVKVTVTQLLIAAAARYLKGHPEVNVKCQSRKFYQRRSIDMFSPVFIPGRRDLSGVILRDCEQMSLAARYRKKSLRSLQSFKPLDSEPISPM